MPNSNVAPDSNLAFGPCLSAPDPSKNLPNTGNKAALLGRFNGNNFSSLTIAQLRADLVAKGLDSSVPRPTKSVWVYWFLQKVQFRISFFYLQYIGLFSRFSWSKRQRIMFQGHFRIEWFLQASLQHWAVARRCHFRVVLPRSIVAEVRWVSYLWRGRVRRGGIWIVLPILVRSSLHSRSARDVTNLSSTSLILSACGFYLVSLCLSIVLFRLPPLIDLVAGWGRCQLSCAGRWINAPDASIAVVYQRLSIFAVL